MDEQTPCSTPSRESSPFAAARRPLTRSIRPTGRSSTVNADYIRDATLCMLRRQEGNNVPAMSRYLNHYFSEIPEELHMPIIVATFSAAQKVAANHGDTLLPGDDERICWARRSLARWTHGLSGVEKSIPSLSSETDTPSNASEDSGVASLLMSSLVQAETNVDNRASDLAVEREIPPEVCRSSSSEQGLTRDESVDGDAEVPAVSAESEVISSRSVDSSLELSGISDSSQNVFASRSLPVPMESAFAQADVNAVLKEVVSTSIVSESISVSDNGPDEVLVSSAEPDIDSLLQQDSLPVPPSMPGSFDDLLDDAENGTVRDQLLRPLSIVITPLSTPRVDRVRDEDGNQTDQVINLFPSPHPSLEEDTIVPPNASVPQDVQISGSRSSIKEGKLKGIKIKRKTVEKGDAVE